MMRVLIGIILSLIFAAPCFADGEFKDVPKGHWAAESVSILAQNGIIKGYKDNTYKGDKPITRYELAVALERLIYFIQQSQKPVQLPEDKQTKDSSTQSSTDFLVKGGYISSNSDLLKNPEAPVTKEQLAQVLSSVAAKLVENNVPVKDSAETEDSTNQNSNSH